MVFAFEKLEVWQNSLQLTLKVYRLIQLFPKTEMYALTDQVKRAVASVSANIAEGVSRKTQKDQAHFTNIAFSSLMEVLNHLLLAKELGYIEEENLKELRVDIERISNQLNALYHYQSQQCNK